MNKQPLLILLICFVLGILFQEYLILSELYVFILLLFSIFFLGITFFKFSFFRKIKHYFLSFFFFTIGIFLHFQNSQKPEIPSIKEKETVVFQLDKKLNSNEKNRKYIVEILDIPNLKNKKNHPVNAVLSLPKDLGQLDFDHFYKAQAYIHQPEKITNNFQFDYGKYLERQQIYFQAYLPNEFQKTEKTAIFFPDKIRQKRLEILNEINQTSLSPKIQEFLKGIILSDRTEMDAETVKDFNQTGLVHLLAISGSHMVIIFWITLLIFNKIIPFRFRKLSIIFSLIFIWTFAVFIDYGSSVVRSCLMISCYYIMVLLQRKSDLLHSLALSAFVILVVDSQQFFDVGFQLSYVAVLGIWWLTIPIKKLFRKPKFWIEKFFYEITAMTFAAQIATLPLVIYYFHQFSFVSVFANLVIIPLSEIIIVSSLFIVILIAFGIQLSWLFNIFDIFIQSVLKAIHWFSGFDSLMNKNISINLLEMSILFLTIYFLKFLLTDFRNPKDQLRFMFSLLLFFGLRISFNIYNYNKKEIFVNHFYKDKIIGIKKKNKVYFWMKDDRNKVKILDFVINPYLTSRRISDYEIRYFPEETEGFVFEEKKYKLK